MCIIYIYIYSGLFIDNEGWRATTANTRKPIRQLLLLYLFFSKPGGIVGAIVQDERCRNQFGKRIETWQNQVAVALSFGPSTVRTIHVSFMYHYVSLMYHSCMFQYISLIKNQQFLIWLICLLSSRALGMLLALNWSKDPGKFQGRATLDPPVPAQPRFVCVSATLQVGPTSLKRLAAECGPPGPAVQCESCE